MQAAFLQPACKNIVYTSNFCQWSELCNKSGIGSRNKKLFCLGICFFIFLKKQMPNHYFISPPEAAKYL